MQPLLTTPQEAVNWLKQHGCHQLTLDSRQIGRGHAFVAILGKKYDGRKMLPEAQAKGALAALLEAQAIEPLLSSTPLSEALPCALYRGIAQDLAQIACLFYDHPSDKLEAILAVTGTNGKTSIAWWLHQAFFALGKPCAYIGTLGMCLEQMTVDATKPNSLTTPDSVSLQTMLFELVHKKIKYCALEASSIALEQGRILGTQIKIAIFTNLTHDHLDYHGDLATYFSAKKRLFQQTGIQHAVVNIDDPWGMKLMQELKAESRIKVVSFGFHPQADYQLTQVIANPQTAGYKFSLSSVNYGHLDLKSPVWGSFNLINIAAVALSLLLLNFKPEEVVHACQDLQPIPGRMQIYPLVKNPLTFIDYAHTPDALEKVLLSLRHLSESRQGHLYCVVGCGGSRDKLKRPSMAKIACQYADYVFLTSDNPRDEALQTIFDDMQSGIEAGVHHYNTEDDRKIAIRQALQQANARDVVLIAGKGHENYQEIKGTRYPFSDYQVVDDYYQSGGNHG